MKGGLRLSAQQIVSHIVMVLKDQAMRKLFGADYSKILSKDFLSIWKYQCDMRDEHWKGTIGNNVLIFITYEVTEMLPHNAYHHTGIAPK